MPKSVKTAVDKDNTLQNALDKMQRAIFFMPIPKLDEKEYAKLTDGLAKRTIINYNNLGLKIIFSTSYPGYAAYNNHYSHIRKVVEMHARSLAKNAAKIPVSTEVIEFPKTAEQLNELKAKASALKRTDFFLFNAHGNNRVIGMGCFELDAAAMVDQLCALEIDKHKTPVIALWACKTGAPLEDRKSNNNNNSPIAEIADKDMLKNVVAEEMVGSGFLSPVVYGIDGLLLAMGETKKSVVAEKVKGRNGEKRETPVKDRDTISYTATPKTAQIMDENEYKAYNGPNTQLVIRTRNIDYLRDTKEAAPATPVRTSKIKKVKHLKRFAIKKITKTNLVNSKKKFTRLNKRRIQEANKVISNISNDNNMINKIDNNSIVKRPAKEKQITHNSKKNNNSNRNNNNNNNIDQTLQKSAQAKNVSASKQKTATELKSFNNTKSKAVIPAKAKTIEAKTPAIPTASKPKQTTVAHNPSTLFFDKLRKRKDINYKDSLRPVKRVKV